MSAGYMDVKIMGREYRVACTPEDQEQLLKVVALVDEKMTDIANKTRNAIPERVAVMAAMSIGIDLLTRSDPQNSSPSATHEPGSLTNTAVNETTLRLQTLSQRIDAVLQQSDQDLET